MCAFVCVCLYVCVCGCLGGLNPRTKHTAHPHIGTHTRPQTHMRTHTLNQADNQLCRHRHTRGPSASSHQQVVCVAPGCVGLGPLSDSHLQHRSLSESRMSCLALSAPNIYSALLPQPRQGKKTPDSRVVNVSTHTYGSTDIFH